MRGGWRHVVASWDGTAKRIYVDGVLSASKAALVLDSALPIVVGAADDARTLRFHFQGSLDELELYDRALDDAEVAQLAAQ